MDGPLKLRDQPCEESTGAADAGRKLVAELRALGVEAEFILADVRREEDVRDLVDRTVARFGRLDGREQRG
jgi:NAD(P)-dependent dehydrogenase (short-subunit alcohol dehydrogenase family)